MIFSLFVGSGAETNFFLRFLKNLSLPLRGFGKLTIKLSPAKLKGQMGVSFVVLMKWLRLRLSIEGRMFEAHHDPLLAGEAAITSPEK